MIQKINAVDGIEVGSVPKDVGLERMRWDGEKLVDLFELSSMWVELNGGVFILHCIQTPNSQLVEMEYKDRKKLWNNNGIFEIKTSVQEEVENNIEYRKSHYPPMGNQMGAIMKYLSTKTDLTEELQKIIDDIESVKEKYNKTINAQPKMM